MNILYCNVGDMNYYNGIENDSIIGGGSFNRSNIGHEVNNFTNHNGTFYGYVQSNNETIDISKHFECDINAEYYEPVLIIWVVKKKYIAGYYMDARVYHKLQSVPTDIRSERMYSDYNITSKKGMLIPSDERKNFQIEYKSRTNIWYGEPNTDKNVIAFIDSYNAEMESRLHIIEEFSDNLVGTEREAVVKVRENQGVFRDLMLKKYNRKCCLCGVTKDEMLIASHIKPWGKSDDNEKLSVDNGLLLCPTHDKAFDKGFISFEKDGSILISSEIDEINRVFINISNEIKLPEKILTNAFCSFMKYHKENIFRP